MPFSNGPDPIHFLERMDLESFLTNDLTPALVQEVEGFLDSQDTAHPFQFPQWSDPGSKLMLFREGGNLRWTAAFGVYRPLGWKVPWIRAAAANRGPVCDDPRLWAAAAEKAAGRMRRDRLTYVEVSPDWIQRDERSQQSFLKDSEWECSGSQRWSLRLDLTIAEDRIFANFSKNSRYEVRHAERLGATVNAASKDAEIEEFLVVYQGMAALKGFPADQIERVRRQVQWLVHAQSRGALLLARAKDTVLGGAVIGRAGLRCWYIWGATDRKQSINVGHILQWNAIRWAKSHGCTQYDFGGYTPGATSGPAWFKAGFGGTPVEFVAPHRRVIRPVSYRVFSFLSNVR